MELTAIQGNHVDFSAASEAGMKSLGNTKDGDIVTIHVEQNNDNKIHIPLMAPSKCLQIIVACVLMLGGIL
jgi:hypothetical protein